MKIFASKKDHAQSTREIVPPIIPKAVSRTRQPARYNTLVETEFDFVYRDSESVQRPTIKTLSQQSRTMDSSPKASLRQGSEPRQLQGGVVKRFFDDYSSVMSEL